MKKRVLIGLVGGLALAAAAVAQTVTQPQVTSIGATDLFQDVVGGVGAAGNKYAVAPLLGNYAATLPGNNPENYLIGGDAATNLFQRATSGASVTTTLTYGGPDRWAYWSGTSTAMTVSQDTTAGDLPTGYKAAFKMARTSGQTGVVQMCMAQEVESVNAYQLQGATAEIDFHAITGANFSAASGNMTVYLISGTGSDQGLAGSNSAAFNLNAGGGGSGAWTGQVNTGVVVSLGGPSTAGRYTVAIPVPTGATEIAVALCFTPVGTASTNDYIAFSGIQLTRNNALATAAGTAGVALAVNDTRAKSFSRRSQTLEAALQYRYFYKLAEGAAIQTRAPCAAITTTTTNCMIFFPVPMRQAPVFTGDGGFTAGFATPTSTTQATLGACTTLALATVVTSTVASVNNALITCTASTIPAAGIASFLYDNNGSGIIKASAEL